MSALKQNPRRGDFVLLCNHMEFSLGQLPKAAEQIIAVAKRSFATDHATLITFSGDLGAGKTTLIQEIAKQLGVTETLQSPTYVIYKKYSLRSAIAESLPLKEGDSEPWGYLVHGDMYRLESVDEILKLGWDGLLTDPKNILLIEWPEKIAKVIPGWAVQIKISHMNETVRHIDII